MDSNNGTKVMGKAPKMNNSSKKKTNTFASCVNVFKGLYHKAVNMFFPANIKCIVCGDDLPAVQQIEVCAKCQSRMHFIAENECCQCCGAPVFGEAKYCFNCKDNPREFDLGRSVFVYEDNVEKLIAGLKFNNKPYLSRTLGRYLAELYKELNWQVDLVVPVPMTPARKKWRGYNQAELLAQEFCDTTGLTINTEALVKVKDTDEQKSLSLHDRQKNIKEAFKVADKYSIKGKNILIIDDVMTTGATANACASALKKAHANRVYVLTLAHGKPKIPSQNTLEDIKSVINSVK